MISFEREGNRFRIKLSGDRQRIYANNVTEMQQALAHYYSSVCSPLACPLCAASAIAQKRLERKGGD